MKYYKAVFGWKSMFSSYSSVIHLTKQTVVKKYGSSGLVTG